MCFVTNRISIKSFFITFVIKISFYKYNVIMIITITTLFINTSKQKIFIFITFKTLFNFVFSIIYFNNMNFTF